VITTSLYQGAKIYKDEKLTIKVEKNEKQNIEKQKQRDSLIT